MIIVPTYICFNIFNPTEKLRLATRCWDGGIVAQGVHYKDTFFPTLGSGPGTDIQWRMRGGNDTWSKSRYASTSPLVNSVIKLCVRSSAMNRDKVGASWGMWTSLPCRTFSSTSWRERQDVGLAAVTSWFTNTVSFFNGKFQLGHRIEPHSEQLPGGVCVEGLPSPGVLRGRTDVERVQDFPVCSHELYRPLRSPSGEHWSDIVHCPTHPDAGKRRFVQNKIEAICVVLFKSYNFHIIVFLNIDKKIFVL